MKKGDIGLPFNVIIIIIISIVSLITLILFITMGGCIVSCPVNWDALYADACIKLINNCGVSWDDQKLSVNSYTLHEICVNKFGANIQETDCKSSCLGSPC